MAEQTENPKREYKKRFEKAVDDAQYMMVYASTNCPNEIKGDTLERLITARLRVEKQEELSAKEEADFWDAYQDLWKLVQPAAGESITADSIRASLPVESTFSKRLSEAAPALSKWWETRTASKARGSVNRYIVFTVFVLMLVLIFQIYWVIGNQLSAQLDQLAQAEKDLKVQITENAQTDRQKDLDSLESQLLQTSLIFLEWSEPWNVLIPEWDSGLSSKYPPLYAEIDLEIKKIDDQLRDDPDGTKAAENDKAILDVQLAELAGTTNEEDKNKLDTKITLVELESFLVPELTSLDAKEDIVQGQIDERQKTKETLEERLIALTAEREVILGNLADQKSSLNAQLIDLEAQLNSLGVPLDYIVPTSTPTPTDALRAEETTDATEVPAVTEVPAATEVPTATDTPDVTDIKNKRKAILKQIEEIDNLLAAELARTQSADIQGQINDIDNQLSVGAGQDARFEDQKKKLKTLLDNLPVDTNAVQGEINKTIEGSTLTEQLIGLDAAREVVQGKIEGLRSQIESLQINIEKSPEVKAKLKQVGAQIVGELNQEKTRWEDKRKALERQEQVDSIDSIREDARPAQLAGQFVLVILQSYLLPLLYGILGAATFVLRSLSRQIKNVTYSERSGIQHLLHIALGALSGIMVGWFSFLIQNESFIGSVSPLAIAFFVGYNIELFFTKMDEIVVTKLAEIRQRTSATVAEGDRTAALQKALTALTTQAKSFEEAHRAEGASKQTKPNLKEEKGKENLQKDSTVPSTPDKPDTEG